MVLAPNSPDSAFVILKNLVASYSSSEETLMDIFKSRSYMQKIKSKHRVSETLVIDKKDFFDLVNSLLAVCGPNKDSERSQKKIMFNSDQVREIESCVQLTPKKPSMFAIRHVESLFQVLIDAVHSNSPSNVSPTTPQHPNLTYSLSYTSAGQNLAAESPAQPQNQKGISY